MILFDQVSKSYGATPALRGTSFEVKAGEVVGFVGPNGAGKTTCLRIMVGLVFRDSGGVTVAGVDPADRPVEARRSVGYLPGETSLYPRMTGRELLRFGHSYFPAIDERRRDELLELFELPLDRKIAGYSAGMKQKLALVTALSPSVGLFLLDEPDRNLDSSMRIELRRILRGLAAEGRTVLLSSHHLAEVEQVAGRLVFVRNGLVVPDDLVTRVRGELAREVKVTLRPGQEIPPDVLAATARVSQDHGLLRLLPSGEPEELASRILPLRPLRLEYGHPDLEEIYARLYVEGKQ